MKKPEKKPPFSKQRPVPLFPGKFAICVADTLEEAERLASTKHLKRAPTGACGFTLGGAIKNGGRFAVIVSRRWLMHGIIAHEMRHTTNDILAYAGVQADHSNDEPGAYLQDALTSWVYRELDCAGETVKLDK